MRRLAATLALILLAGAAHAGETRFNGTAFTLPDGWTLDPNARGGAWHAQRRFTEGPERGAAVIEFVAPIPLSEGSFDSVFDRLAASVTGLEKQRPTTKGAGVTADGHPIRTDARCCARRNNLSIGTDTVGVTDGQRHAVMMLVGVGLHGDAARTARADFDAVVRSFRLDADAAPPALAPPPGAGGLEGTFGHLSTSLMPNAFGGLDFRADNEVRVFDRDGLFSRAVPAAGEDVPAHCRARPADCGTYRLLGAGLLHGPDRIELREMTARYGLMEVTEQPFARDGDGLRIGEGAHRRLPPLPRGTAFDGTWRYFFASSGSSAFASGSVAVERVLTLTPDGRFRRSGFSGATSTVETGGGRTGFTTGRERPAGTGRYEAEGFRLTLVGDDGRRDAHSLVLPDGDADAGKAKLLVIDGDNYLRREAK